MPTITFTAFQWSGTGYNAVYNTSVVGTMTDDDPNFEGGADSNESVTINGGPAQGTESEPYAINVSFTDTSGAAHVETFFFFRTNFTWYFIPGPGSAFTIGATLGTYQSHETGYTYDEAVCFTNGTLIETETGPKPVETLQPGDRVLRHDGTCATLRMNASHSLSAKDLARNPKLRPVRIRAGALGRNLPYRDLCVSRQHRMLVSSRIAERMTGTQNSLVAAVRLIGVPGIAIDQGRTEVTYHHLLFDRHEVILAEGAPSESLYTGAEALKSLCEETRAEIYTLFPELTAENYRPTPACPILSGPRQKKLISRHLKNKRALLSA